MASTNTQIQVFENSHLNAKLQAVEFNGEPAFVAKDICEYFGDSHYRRSLARLDADEKGVTPLATPGGTQNVSVVTEAGLYNLLFHMQPQNKKHLPKGEFEKRIAKLKAFKRWVTHEVLPSIRRTNGYVTPETLDKIARNPEAIYELAAALLEEREQRHQAEEKLQYLKPKTPFGSTSRFNGKPRIALVNPYWRTMKTTVITETTEYQLSLFE